MASHHHISVKKTGGIALVALFVTWVAMSFPTNTARATGALLGGILPALFWLWFWLHEDKVHPEPKKIIFEAFMFGIIAVPVAIFFEKISFEFIGKLSLFLFLIWAIIEEVLKYGAAFLAGIRTEYFDEPIDVVIYMISAALGFSAAENVLFIFSTFQVGTIAEGLTLLQLRFIGASLLHVATSALIGFSIGFALEKTLWKKWLYLFIGMTSAFALHTAFNYFIMISEGKFLFNTFILLWAVIILIIVLFEKIKQSPFYVFSFQESKPTL